MLVYGDAREWIWDQFSSVTIDQLTLTLRVKLQLGHEQLCRGPKSIIPTSCFSEVLYKELPNMKNAKILISVQIEFL